MPHPRNPLHTTELTRASLPAFAETVAAFDPDADPVEPRSYPGYPRVALPAVRPRRLCALDQTLLGRRCRTRLTTTLPDAVALARLLRLGHGLTKEKGKGPPRGMIPSAGGLQALELYLAVPAETRGWLAAGSYHYDRARHLLAQLSAVPTGREKWSQIIPSLRLLEGGAALWILSGDLTRAENKYGDRAARFLLQESGHLMQNLCVLSASVGMCTVPLGAFLEREVAAALCLPPGDAVLYVGAVGG